MQTVNKKKESSEESSDEEDEEETENKLTPGKRKTDDNEDVELKVKKPNNNYNNFVKAGQNVSIIIADDDFLMIFLALIDQSVTISNK